MATAAGGSFRTELATMQAASRHVFAVNEQIQAQLAGLLGRLEPLLGAWQGGAASSFQVLHQRWHADATRLNAALRGIGEALVATQANYAQTEEQNQQGFTSMSAALG